MRRTDVVRMIRPFQLALALTPLIVLALPGAATRAATRALAAPVTQSLHATHVPGSFDRTPYCTR